MILEEAKTITIDDTVSIGGGVKLGQGVELLGKTSVGDLARIGAHSVLTDCEVKTGTEVAPHTVVDNKTI